MKTYDSRCYELAEVFLMDSPTLNTEERRNELAALIQRTIEDWISYEERQGSGPVKPESTQEVKP